MGIMFRAEGGADPEVEGFSYHGMDHGQALPYPTNCSKLVKKKTLSISAKEKSQWWLLHIQCPGVVIIFVTLQGTVKHQRRRAGQEGRATTPTLLHSQVRNQTGKQHAPEG